MIKRNLADIGPGDIQALVGTKTPEGRSLDFKQELPPIRQGGSQSGQARKILDTAVAFANTDGGDLVFGVAEADGRADRIVGLTGDRIDEAIRGLEDFVRSSTSPPVQIDVFEVQGLPEGPVVVARIPRSPHRPHAAREGKHSRFYKRGSRQNVLLDMHEVRELWRESEAGSGLRERKQGQECVSPACAKCGPDAALFEERLTHEFAKHAGESSRRFKEEIKKIRADFARRNIVSGGQLTQGLRAKHEATARSLEWYVTNASALAEKCCPTCRPEVFKEARQKINGSCTGATGAAEGWIREFHLRHRQGHVPIEPLLTSERTRIRAMEQSALRDLRIGELRLLTESSATTDTSPDTELPDEDAQAVLHALASASRMKGEGRAHFVHTGDMNVVFWIGSDTVETKDPEFEERAFAAFESLVTLRLARVLRYERDRPAGWKLTHAGLTLAKQLLVKQEEWWWRHDGGSLTRCMATESP